MWLEPFQFLLKVRVIGSRLQLWELQIRRTLLSRDNYFQNILNHFINILPRKLDFRYFRSFSATWAFAWIELSYFSDNAEIFKMTSFLKLTDIKELGINICLLPPPSLPKTLRSENGRALQNWQSDDFVEFGINHWQRLQYIKLSICRDRGVGGGGGAGGHVPPNIFKIIKS